MTNQNENEKEKILDQIHKTKEEIYEARSYISSEYCRRCSEIYEKISKLEQTLKLLQEKLIDNERLG